MKPAFFVDRPVFAAVVSFVIVIIGAISVFRLPIDQYPYISPPAVRVTAEFPGASARTALEAVATPLEEELNGVPNMEYMRSNSSKSGRVDLVITFAVDSDQNLAAIDVQNATNQAIPLLPSDVRQEGVSIEKEASVELLKVALLSDDPKYDDVYLSNYTSINLSAALRRIPGVGRVRNTGRRRYAMRIWLRPDHMAAHGIVAEDVIKAVQEQNSEAAAGTLGALPDANVELTAPITTEGRMQTAAEFERIVIRASPDGSVLRLRDIGRAELGVEFYRTQSKLNGVSAAVIQIYLLPGANALEVAARVKTTMADLAENFPDGLRWTTWFDASKYIQQAVNEVLVTLAQALLIVVAVVWAFLKSWRTTLIPALAVPVSIIGTFGAMAAFGFTLNTVNLLALVLAIGIVVDDAIVVVENVEHLMKQEGLSAREATLQAMRNLTGALVATSLVLAAVFVPVSFLGGITGILYREFAVSITVAVLISTLVALTLSPALCALLLKAGAEEGTGPVRRLLDQFERLIDHCGRHYTRWVAGLLSRSLWSWLAFVLVIAAGVWLATVVPTSFMPAEDQGRFFVDLDLPPGQSVLRSAEMADKAYHLIESHPAVDHVFSLAGESKRSGYSDSSAFLEVILKDWSIRKKQGDTVEVVIADLAQRLDLLIEARVHPFQPSAIAGLGSGSGVEMELEDRTGTQFSRLLSLTDELLRQLRSDKTVASAGTALQKNIPLYRLQVDRSRAKALGVDLDAIYTATNVFAGSYSVSDFNLFGRVYRVKLQAESSFRDRPDALDQYYVRADSGAMVPLSVVAQVEAGDGPAFLIRNNMFSSASISVTPAEGFSSGDVIDKIREIAGDILPIGFAYDWTGLTFQEIRSAGQLPTALALAFIFVFLFLAALYESWTIPVAVILIVPIAMTGALGAIALRGLEADMFFQIAFIALIGLSAKNSILIVEFARQLRDQGAAPLEAALKAAQLRFRPILMTAASFILGILPLVLSTGPGSISRQTISTAILGGMVLATTIGILLVPLFFVGVAKLADKVSMRAEPTTESRG